VRTAGAALAIEPYEDQPHAVDAGAVAVTYRCGSRWQPYTYTA
jgi:hypothetical protein